MDIFSIIAAVPMALNVSSAPIAQPLVDQNNTNTKIEFQIKSDVSAPDGEVSGNENKAPLNFDGYQPVDPKEAGNKAKLDKWKAKQENLWKSLPSDKFSINASAYTASSDECGKGDGITSSGIEVHKGTLACPPQFPFGTKINIEGQGTFVCEDRGGAIKGNHFDIYMQTKNQAFAFGRRNLLAEVVE